MLTYENRLWEQGVTSIAGVDEVGRGCLFGDVVAAAVILPQGCRMPEVRDSKQLSEKTREQLYTEICETALAVGIGRVDASGIDRLNIRQATRLAMKQAVLQLAPAPDYILIDAETVDLPMAQLSIVKGDANCQAIAAASIVAKVTRDRLCIEWDRLYPEYGLARHKGYATKQHREALLTHGPSPLHRRSFLGKLLGDRAQQQLELF